jgi:hypothetical protein
MVAGMTEDLRPVPETPLRLKGGKLQQEYVVTRYDPKTGRQKSQEVEWRYVK